MRAPFTSLIILAIATGTSLAAPAPGGLISFNTVNTPNGAKGGNAISGKAGNANGGSVANQGSGWGVVVSGFCKLSTLCHPHIYAHR
jgi:hypothetical protein